jgi:hypothetical protein
MTETDRVQKLCSKLLFQKEILKFKLSQVVQLSNELEFAFNTMTLLNSLQRHSKIAQSLKNGKLIIRNGNELLKARTNKLKIASLVLQMVYT